MQGIHDVMLHMNPCNVRIELLYYYTPLCCVFPPIFRIWISLCNLRHDDRTRSSSSIALPGIVGQIVLVDNGGS